MDQENLHNRIFLKPWNFGLLLAAILLLTIWLLYTPSGILGKADAVGYAVCHRIDSRSFHLGERTLPLCARCSGQYLGAIFGILYLAIIAPRKTDVPSRSILFALLIFVIAYTLDGLNSYFHLTPMVEMFPSFPRPYAPNNMLRLITGSGMGFSIGVVLFIAFNRTMWSKSDKSPVIADLKQFGLGMFLLMILDLLILTEDPLILYPLSIVSALSVVLLLSMIYSLIITMIFHLENRISNISQLIFPMGAGFFLAILQLAILDALRYLITGTWEGFQL
jgi:uncharacterized membrane protein